MLYMNIFLNEYTDYYSRTLYIPDFFTKFSAGKPSAARGCRCKSKKYMARKDIKFCAIQEPLY